MAPSVSLRLPPPRAGEDLLCHAMRYAILLALLTVGASSPNRTSQALECRLPYPEAAAALARLPVQSHEDYPGEDGYKHVRKFDTDGLTAFGYPVDGMRVIELDAIAPHTDVVITISIKGSGDAVRAAALASRGKRTCTSTEGPKGFCEIDRREQEGWTNTLLMLDHKPVLSCLYSKTAS